MLETEQLIENIIVFIILIAVVLNTVLVYIWTHNQTKKTDALYDFIEKLSSKSSINKKE